MVGRAPKKQRSRVESHSNPRHARSIQENRISPQPLFSASVPVDPCSTTNSESIAPLGHFPLPEINNDFAPQVSLGDYDDIPQIPPGMSDGFWIDAADFLQGPNPDSQQVSNTARLEDAPFIPNDHRALDFRTQLLERTAAQVPRQYRDKSIVMQYPHAAALMGVIEYLEGHLQIVRVPIDQAMRSNRDAMSTVRAIIDLEEFKRCQSCPSLVATIMDLVVSLYELVILSIQNPTDEDGMMSFPVADSLPDEVKNSLYESSRESSSGSGRNERPLFQFGCLEFDPDEQEIFRNAMVRRDLGRYIETIHHCCREIQQRQSRAAELNEAHYNLGGLRLTKSGTGRAQLKWYQEMENQANGLLTSLPATCRHEKDSS